MKSNTVRNLLNENYNALTTAKGHNKSTVKTCIALLEEMPQDLIIYTRHNTATPSNAGDIAEIWAGLQLGFLDKNSVAITENDLPMKRKNEIKLCYSNNRPSNDIQDKGHYMVTIENGLPKIQWVKREIVRACKDSLIKGRRGGTTYARAVQALL